MRHPVHTRKNCMKTDISRSCGAGMRARRIMAALFLLFAVCFIVIGVSVPSEHTYAAQVTALKVTADGTVCNVEITAEDTAVKSLTKGKTLSYTRSSTCKTSSYGKVTSSDPKVAEVTEKSGKYYVEGKNVGTSTLKLYNQKGAQTAKICLIVTDSQSFTGNTSTVTLYSGKTKTFSTKTAKELKNKVSVKYSSSKPNVAAVNSKTGKIRAKKVGSAKITAKMTYKGKTIKSLTKKVNVVKSSLSVKDKDYLVKDVSTSEYYDIVKKFTKNTYFRNRAYLQKDGATPVWLGGTRWDCSTMTLYFVNYYLLSYKEQVEALSKKHPGYTDGQVHKAALKKLPTLAKSHWWQTGDRVHGYTTELLSSMNAGGQLNLWGKTVFHPGTARVIDDDNPEEEIDGKQLKPGDMLYYGENGSTITVTHTAIYLGEYYGSGQGYYMMENTPRKTTAKGEMRSIKSGKNGGARIWKFSTRRANNSSYGLLYVRRIIENPDKMILTNTDAEDDSILLSGAEFEIHEWSNDKGDYKKAVYDTFTDCSGNPGVYEYDTLKLTGGNDKNGSGVSRWKIIETKAPTKAYKNGKKVELPGDYSGNVGKSWTIAVTQGVDKEETITNETSKTMSLTITMADADNSKIRLSGAELVVHEWSNQYGRYLKRSCGTMKESDDKPGVYSIEGLEVTSDNDKNGTGTARYQIEETKAPTKAYKKKNGAWAEMDLPADSDSSVGKTWTYAIQSGRDEKDTIGK